MSPEPAYPTHSHLTLVDPDERLGLRLGQSLLFYRRLSLGALAAIERQQALTLAEGGGDGPLTLWLPPAALEAAVCAHVLVGWQGVREPRGNAEVPYDPALASRLPAGARRPLLRRAQKIHPPHGDVR